MNRLNLPPYEFKLSSDKTSIFDVIRKKFIVLQPEEWVRQHFVNYLINHLGYPAGLIKVEFGISYNKLSKRPDILAYDRAGNPLLLIECKSYDIKTSKSVFEQVAVYNKVIKAPYVVVTNGLQHFCWSQNEETGKVDFMDEVPEFEELVK
ncbi:MAG: hypothetical protein ACI9GZ_003199 [Bacteroidia bacterium]|jgi:hypothetical protein